MKGRLKCFSCEKFEHRARECYSCMQDKRKKSIATNAGQLVILYAVQKFYCVVLLVHTKKAYKVACVLPVKKFNTMEVGTPEKERFKIKSEDKKNAGQNSEEYCELND